MNARSEFATRHGPPGTPPIVLLKGIAKYFPGVVANEDVTLEVWGGEIHALLGENGAGKSTLMNILTGIYTPDAGEIIIDGYAKTFASPIEAIAAGIGMVHQHFKLVKASRSRKIFTSAGRRHRPRSAPRRWKAAPPISPRRSIFRSSPTPGSTIFRPANSSGSKSFACWPVRPAC
jgi:hypothetical protein